MLKLQQARGEGCLSDFVLDRLVAGELAADARARAEAHLSGCAQCSARLTQLKAEAAAVASEPVDAIASRLVRRSKGRRWAVIAAPFAALAASVLVVLAVNGLPRNDVRPKGGLGLRLAVKHLDGATEMLGATATARGGEAIRFAVTAGTEGHLVIVGIDSAGAVTAYAPAAGASALAMPAGPERLLDGSIVLDDTVGPERIVAELCEKPVAVDEVVRAAAEALKAAGGRPDAVRSLALGCQEATVTLEKVAR